MGAERFARWVKWSGLSDAEVGRRLRCDASYAGKILRGERHPGLAAAVAIAKLTAVPRDDGKKWNERPIACDEWIDDETKGAA